MKLQRDVKVTEPFGHNHLIAACAADLADRRRLVSVHG